MVELKSLPAIAILFLLAAVILPIGINIITNIPGSGNTSITVTVSPTQALGNVTIAHIYNLTVTSNLTSGSGSAINSTAGNITSNATFNYTAGEVVFDANYTGVNVTYSYTYPQIQRSVQNNASVSAQQGAETFANWLPIIAIGVAAALIIGLLVGLKFFRKGGDY